MKIEFAEISPNHKKINLPACLSKKSILFKTFTLNINFYTLYINSKSNQSDHNNFRLEIFVNAVSFSLE